jgi:hypothetical protein
VKCPTKFRAVHLNGFFDAVDKLGEMDVGINPDLLAIMLLYSLPSSFENFRCAIESRDELPDPETLRVKIIEENDARKNCMRSVPENAMFRRKNHGTGRTNQIGNSLKKKSHEILQTKMKSSNFVVTSAVNTVTKQMSVRIRRTRRIKTVTIQENMRKMQKICHFVHMSNRLLMVVNINGV